MIETVLMLISVSLVNLFVFYFLKKYNYWNKRCVLGPKPFPFVGNFGKVMMTKESITMLTNKLYSQYINEKVIGIYSGINPMLIIKDPNIIKEVLVKNFGNFSDRGMGVTKEPLLNNVFNAETEYWKKLRHTFTPMFSSGKIKLMSPLIQTCVNEFQTHVDKIVDENIPHEMRSLMAKYTLEVIGCCAFGLKLGALTQEQNIFREIGDIIFKPRIKSTIWRGINVIIPGIIKFFNITLSNPKLPIFFRNLVAQVVRERNGKVSNRMDFIDLLIELKERSEINKKDENLFIKITYDVMAAQALVFYAAGFETTSITMSFLLYELALNQDCQEKVYEEIKDVFQKYGKWSYEAFSEMKYLEMALDEVLRKHPPGGMTMRRCVADYTFTGMKLKINKDVKIIIPIYSLHHDPQYFERPDEFIPERFSIENKRNIKPFTYLPFGEGPRNCLGIRFAKMESMLGIAGFLHKFKVEPSVKTKVPMEYEPNSLTTKSKDGVWLNIIRR